jgi:SAM-dependent methyltransferase
MDYREQFFEECRSVVGDLSGLSVLIPGSGRGLECILFAEAGARVTGMDIRMDGRATPYRNVRYHGGSIEGCALPSNHYDVVFCIATMEHVLNIEAAFLEMVRLARPGGLIYSVAAPLWNSRHGHHVNCFEAIPWIHLRFAREEIPEILEKEHFRREDIDVTLVDYLSRVHRMPPELIGLEHVLDFVFTSDHFNRAPARRYLAACETLPVSEVVRHDIWMDGEQALTALAPEPSLQQHSRDELLATSHIYIGRK